MKKTIVITGGTGGIGYAVAIALAKQGNDIIFQGRDADKGRKIAEELSKINGTNARFIAADVSSIEGMKALALGIKKITNKIDILIQATGILNSERQETKDGLYESFAVNYLCKFMLDYLLVDELKSGRGKVIIVGGPLRRGATINFDDLQMNTNYSLFNSIGRNQLAIHMHAQEFIKRYGGSIPINVVNAGMVKTGIDRKVKGIMKLMFLVLGPILANSIESAIVNVIALADTDGRDAGYFFPKVAKPAIKERIDLDTSVASKLWDESIKIGKLNV
ncbi:NAD(P)-dependent dehydrogenase (short-subunit alcohol dehydrogenase family) [Pedobacter cryoconitis]|uniref:NAD(P)-dependent dehydrogenase (Short-subunit alcohol dehydrogenase family) n=1 Tax=Pedobacter cryoconitis TaxID=188932 RepID=A0A7W8YXS3_9SPHI|nr:SDR family NAD(P)-dependent oxidoreductase [Pedobacter cryoconitis]MBB5623726.1 NAD(P)-dependent dehydrogenase (short-subunit alcohol dehydrogenase family) [Pedobacter cryoconitis]